MRLTNRQLRRVIRESINEVEFYDETPEGQLRGTEAEDARFTQDLEAEKIMEKAGLTKEEISWMWPAIKDYASDESDAFFTQSGVGKKTFEKLYDYLGFDLGIIPGDIKSFRADMDPAEWILEYLAGEIKVSGVGQLPASVGRNLAAK